MPEDEGYDAVSGQRRVQPYRRWRSPIYWLALTVCVGAAVLLILTVGGQWFWIPLGLWPLAGYIVDRRLSDA